jgi:choline/carnitine/betaine transport
MKPALTHLPIKTACRGFYAGFNPHVAVISKIIVSSLVLWAIVYPNHAGTVLNTINKLILSNTASWYIYIVAGFVLLTILFAIWPAAGRLRLGKANDRPEFSNFSWFSMMFGAGIGVGMLTWAVAEPVYHFQNNPDVIKGLVASSTPENIRHAYKWSFLHWGLGAWACYATCGLALAYFSFRRGLPLTMRSSLTPLFGQHLSGPLGNVIDIVAVVATILGVAQTLGFGVQQFVAGLTRIGIPGLSNDGGTANTLGILVSITIIMGASTASALSGLGKGIKWLSNVNMGLSCLLLLFFLIFGATFFGVKALAFGIWDYMIGLPEMSFTVWHGDSTPDSIASRLATWQGNWSVFYWAWWVAFAPFVGVFLAKISKGRTVREFVLGAIIAPSLMCFVWFTWAGGTAIDLISNGSEGSAIIAAPDGDKIFAMVVTMLGEQLGWVMSIIIVVLLMTYLVTTADSAVLIVNTINAAGDEGPKTKPHILFWGSALALVVAALLVAGGEGGGGLRAIQTAMVIGAFPFSIVMVMQCCSMVKAIRNDLQRARFAAHRAADVN